jgi:hypothetical protein
VAGLAEILDATAAAAAAAAAPAILTGLSPLASKAGGVEVEQMMRRDKKFQRGLVRLGLSPYYFYNFIYLWRKKRLAFTFRLGRNFFYCTCGA